MQFPKLTARIFNKQKSIKGQIQLSYIVIITIMVLPTLYSLTVSKMHTWQYDRIITNVSRANELNQIVKIDISDEIWDIVAGKKTFEEGNQYKILARIKAGITEMMENTRTEKNLQLLEVAARAVHTLERNVDRLGVQMKENAPVSETEKTLEDVRGVASLIHDILQDFIVAEIEAASVTNTSIRQSSFMLSAIQVVIAACVAFFAYYTLSSVSENIRRPILELEQLSNKIASGNLAARAREPDVEELDNLTKNLNMMAGKIQNLIDENIREQQNLKKAEMKTLQAQITPHFLYNTLDTIIWLAEAGKKSDVIEITRALSRFFRISLSKGHEWITVAQEIEHVESYLFIQKIRYRDILDYEIKYDPAMADKPALKLILQPLVENAIYHGIKNKRGRGRLSVEGHMEGKRMLFTVMDNGIGMTPERLEQVNNEIDGSSQSEDLASVYGLYNVSKRLKLYYNYDVKFKIDSTYRSGTVVSIDIPAEGGPDTKIPGETDA